MNPTEPPRPCVPFGHVHTLDGVLIDTYTILMTRRTSINLDFDLVAEAKSILNTTETTETIHRALTEVVRQARLQRLARRRFDVPDADLAELRRSRTDEAAPISASAREPA